MKGANSFRVWNVICNFAPSRICRLARAGPPLPAQVCLHMLRRQALRGMRRPLVVYVAEMLLLRHPLFGGSTF